MAKKTGRWDNPNGAHKEAHQNFLNPPPTNSKIEKSVPPPEIIKPLKEPDRP